VVVTNAYGSTNSSGATLTAVASAPVLTSQPSSIAASEGVTVTFAVSAVGSVPFYYQWELNGNPMSDSGNITGSATSTLTITNISGGNSGTYSVVVSNAVGSISSTGAVLTVSLTTLPGVTLQTLTTFSGGFNGGMPNGLTVGADGKLYGTTRSGGTNQLGTVFQLTTNGVLRSLYSFRGGNDGSYPLGTLIQGQDGNFYGTTLSGGAYNSGTVFRISTNGVLTNLYVFTGLSDGVTPVGGLVQGGDGTLYGTTEYAGAHANGTVFRVTTNGTFTTLYSFTGGATDSGVPQAGLIFANDGGLYGTTSGSFTDGSVFRISTNGAINTLHTFTSSVDGAYPAASLVLASDGKLYGTTSLGTSNDNGSTFSITTNGALTSLYLFTGGSDGGSPDAAGLMQAADGNLYGATAFGGNFNNDGTVFRMTRQGALTTLVWFNGANGANPEAALVQGPDGNLYGTTQNGGPGGQGTIFRLTVPASLLPPGLGSVSLTNGSFNFSWTAVPGQMYQVQSCSGLNPANWINLGSPVTAVSTNVTVSDAVGINARRFYRVMVVSP
jgi:uncharacterized repeat protein (TIGR03803 family)